MESRFVSFYIDQRVYGIDIRLVNDVSRNVSIVPVPRTQSHLRGLVNIRGQVVLVYDLAVIFGFESRPVTGESHLIILKTEQELGRVSSLDPGIRPADFGDKPYALLADQIGDVVSVPEEEIEPPNQYAEQADFHYFRGLVKVDHRIMAILDPMTILFYQSELPKGGPHA